MFLSPNSIKDRSQELTDKWNLFHEKRNNTKYCNVSYARLRAVLKQLLFSIGQKEEEEKRRKSKEEEELQQQQPQHQHQTDETLQPVTSADEEVKEEATYQFNSATSGKIII